MSKKLIVSLTIVLVFFLMITDFRINKVSVFEDFYRHMETKSMRNMYQGGFRFTGETAEKDVNPYNIDPGDNINGVLMDNLAGSINVVGENRDDILLSYKIIVYAENEELAEEFIEKVEVTNEVKEQDVEIKASAPELDEGINSFLVEFDLIVPDDLYLNLINRYGNLDVSQISNDISLRNTYGSLNVLNISGDVNLYSRYDDLYARNISGNAVIDSSYNHTEINGIDGDLNLSAGYNQSRVSNIGGLTDINIKYGSLLISSLDKDLDLKAQYTKVRGDELDGEIEVNFSYGELVLYNLSQDIDINSKYTPIDIKLHNELADFELDLYTKYGDIKTNLDFTIEEEANDEFLQGVYGNGEVKIKIDGSYSDINVNQ